MTKRPHFPPRPVRRRRSPAETVRDTYERFPRIMKALEESERGASMVNEALKAPRPSEDENDR